MKHLPFKFYLLLLLIAFGCSSNSQTEDSNEKGYDTIRPLNVPKKAQLINLGFEDAPVYHWVEYIGHYHKNGTIFSHIYGFKYYDEAGVLFDTVYYEWNKGRIERSDTISKIEEFNMIPFPGNNTIKLTNGNKEFILFSVLEIHDFDRTYKDIKFSRLPRVKTHSNNPKYGLVSQAPIEFNLKELNTNNYLVTLLDMESGFKQFNYKIKGDCVTKTIELSYLNEEDKRIYCVEKGCYLELIKEE